MIKANSSQDLVNVAEALSIASQGVVKLMSVEHAKSIWMEYLRASDYDVPKKVFSKPGIPDTTGTSPVVNEGK